MEKGRNRIRLLEITGILRKHNIISGITPEKLVAILEDLGPTFIKLGQMMSMQPTLPVAYCHRLGKLRAQVTPMSFTLVEQILEREYGLDWKEIFPEVCLKPLGSASIAQVHLASLIDGTAVVIKIQRLGIYDKMASDIMLLRKAAGIIKYTPIGNTVDFEMIIDEMWAITKQEMDFLIEAENARAFAKNNENIAYVGCPKIIEKYSTSTVLVMEYIEGPYIDNLPVLKESGYVLEEIAHKLANNYVKQIVEDGFFHGDPHSGNIIIRDGKIMWIDLGMMGKLTNRDRELFTQAIVAISENDISKLRDFVLSMGVCRRKIDQMALSDDLEAMLLKYGSLNFASMDLTTLSDDFLLILNTHGISIPKGVSMLGRSMATIQGTLRTLSEEINFIEVLANYMSNYYIKNLDIKAELVSALKSLKNSVRKSFEIPAQLTDALKSFTRGTSKVNMDMAMSETMLHKIDRMVNKIIISIITAALLVGSSLICTTDMEPKILGIPAIGFIGYFVAVVMGAWLLLSTLKRKK